MQLLSDINSLQCQTCATIGFFDGVHRGHQFLLERLKRCANEKNLPTLVVTFADSPARLLSPGSQVQLLTTPIEKIALLSQSGIDYCLMLNFDEKLVKLRAEEFLALLHRHFGVRHLLLGYDHHFGSDGLSELADYQKIGKKIGVGIAQVEPLKIDGKIVGSRIIRQLLADGKVEQVNALLGYDYTLSGTVQHGQAIGRTIGFPTANLAVAPRKLLPRGGVYAIETEISGKKHRGLLNIGTRPTISGGEQTVEAHIIDFNGDIYGKNLTIKVQHRLRDEQKFASLAELEHQIEIDRNRLLIEGN